MVQFTVSYGKQNANGKILTKRNTVKIPLVEFKGDPGKVYTLLMSDPDASAKSWLHWLIVNIPGDSLLEGQTVMPYAPPSPPSGTHRYVFTLYEQPSVSIMVSPPRERGNFSVETFEKEHRLRRIVSSIIKVAY
jgi:phosphatidylethanolamine-binding protein (PEBP) family uncharacterized protein